MKIANIRSTSRVINYKCDRFGAELKEFCCGLGGSDGWWFLWSHLGCTEVPSELWGGSPTLGSKRGCFRALVSFFIR
ncbi:hypothetical protein J6590_088300 [Homalodisca vitripennis]|nr:hypothetical protein J6590_095358 [Homalodisca vitripennis]KAG8290192.1 hypothetical protein J6590_088300 [Homalodisca vitripennis]